MTFFVRFQGFLRELLPFWEHFLGTEAYFGTLQDQDFLTIWDGTGFKIGFMDRESRISLQELNPNEMNTLTTSLEWISQFINSKYPSLILMSSLAVYGSYSIGRFNDYDDRLAHIEKVRLAEHQLEIERLKIDREIFKKDISHMNEDIRELKEDMREVKADIKNILVILSTKKP